MKTYILLLLVVFDPSLLLAQSGYLNRHHQMDMGTDTSEIFLCSYWYPHEYDSLYETILYSIDNGLSFSVRNNKFVYVLERPTTIFSDASAGVVYKCPDWAADTFSVSFDTGMTLNKKYFHLPVDPASGCLPGEIYFQTYLSGPVLCRSTDYGSSFDTIPLADSIALFDVGVSPGELYFRGYGADTIINIVTTLDYGATYQSHQIPVPPFITYCFTKGPSPGEFYLLVYDTPYNEFHIYHAIDYGNIVTYQSHHEDCSVYFTSYTAGRKPGTFYVARRSTYDPYLYIDYSADYGVTFTTYVHYLDSTYTGTGIRHNLPSIKVYPNPGTTQVNIELPDENQYVDLLVSDLFGRVCLQQEIAPGSEKVVIDVAKLTKGIYVVQLSTKDNRHWSGKVVVN